MLLAHWKGLMLPFHATRVMRWTAKVTSCLVEIILGATLEILAAFKLIPVLR